MRLRITKVDEYQFLTCLKHQLWGSSKARFKEWHIGDHLAVIVDGYIAALAKVAAKPFLSEEPVWDNGIFPHRIKLHFEKAFLKENRLPVLGEIRDILTNEWGANYGLGILNQLVLKQNPADRIFQLIDSHGNAISQLKAHLDDYLEQAKGERDNTHITKRKAPARVNPPPAVTEVAVTEVSPVDEGKEHSLAQNLLIRLGKITGCSVWIAANDRNRLFRGKPLGDGCLAALPSFGLNKEASSRISLIDVIWVRQNAPICAFEVETTTSVYSGLLRMSDLLAVVPALKVKLFIVAPLARQAKVLDELSRPTFQKIGLSEFCQFLPLEELNSLLSKVDGMAGYIHPSIVDSVAISLPDSLASALQ
jgi:hypothetical protein